MHHVASMLSAFSSFLYFRRLALFFEPTVWRKNVQYPREVVVEAAKGHVTPFRKRVESRVALQKRTVYYNYIQNDWAAPASFCAKSRCVKLKPTTTMSATAASATEIVVDFHEKNGQPPPPPVNDTSEFKSSNTTNNLWLNFFGAADQVGYLKRNIIIIFNF